VSRFFKNIILLAMLRRRLPILPAGPTLLFAAKLAVLTAAIGAATWGVHQAVKRSLPYEQYRQHKVVVDNFETGPDTWFSVNAREIGIVEGPRAGKGLAVMARYDRHGDTIVSLYRDMRAIRAAGPARLEFSVYVADKTDGITVEAETEGRRIKLGDWQFDEGDWWSWVDLEVKLDPAGPPEKIHWMERKFESPRGRLSTLYVDNLRLVDEQSGHVIWSEDFDMNGWTPAGGGPDTARILSAGIREGAERYTLRLSPGAGMVSKDVRGQDLSGVERFRCRLMRWEGEGTVSLTLSAEGAEGSHTVDGLKPGEWRTVDLSWEDLGFESAASLQAVHTVGLDASGAGGDVYLDDVTFRRPPRRMYEVLKAVHCVLPTLAGLAVGLVLLLGLQFQEVRDVREWVKQRGWRKRKGQVEEPAGDVT